MYQKVSTDLKFVDREKKTEKFWADNQIFEKSMENRKEGETYVVEGPYIEKLLRHCNFEDAESMQYFQLALRRKGIIDALENAGCGEGDPVRMYELEFDYTE